MAYFLVTNEIVLAALLFISNLGQASGLELDVASGPKVKVTYAKRMPVLNSVNFNDVVYHGETAAAFEHRFVFFCLPWWAHCQGVREAYTAAALSYERQLNADAVLRLPVRFAEVDCAVDKELCNDELMDEFYPVVAHYHRGELVDSWAGDGSSVKADAKGMANFIERETDFSVPRSDEKDDEASGDKFEVPHDLVGLVPFALTIVMMGVWTASVGIECWKVLSGDEPKKSEQPEQSATTGAQRWLPEPWTREQRSMEL